MNPTAKDYISKFYRSLGEWPETSDIVQNCHCSPQDAEEWLRRCQGSVRAARVREKKPFKFPTVESLVIRFASSLQYFAFLVSSIVDLGLAWFFFYSLGSGDFGKMMLGTMGLVLTGSKLWGWAYSKIDRKALPVALLAALLSIFGNTAIFRAEIEIQAKSAVTDNTVQTDSAIIQGQITAKQSEITLKTAARDKIDLSVESNLPMYNTLDNKVKTANKELKDLTDRLSTVKVSVKSETSTIQLDSWSVFRQWTVIGDNASKVLAYFFTLTFSFLLELIVFSTTPRKEIKKRSKRLQAP